MLNQQRTLQNMLDEAAITQKANQLLVEFRANEELDNWWKGFQTRVYLKDLEWVLQDTGNKQN